MNQFKPIISHQEGQNLFPGIPTVIKGDKAATHITMKNTKPQIAITPYGASYMSPGQDYAFAGNTVVELPTAQMGGQEEDSEAQIMQILQIYAQMKQIPIQQLIQQIQNLSEEEQQQSITAIVQEVQQVMQEQQQQQMAQQQMPMGQEEMGMAEEEMPMAQAGQEKRTEYMEKNPQGYYDYYKSTNTPEGPRYYKGTSPNMSFAQTMANFKAANNPADSTVYSTMPPNVQAAFKEDGGELCFDCYDHYNPFPQAQNLNWFYKAQGGEAFPQANPYPHMYAQGGEAFPQAQTYLPYDRGNKPKPNFMFLEGGTTDIDQAYQVMKRGGMDFNPKKKRGGKFTQDSFQEYVMKNGGYLPKHQIEAIVGQGISPQWASMLSQNPAQNINQQSAKIAADNVSAQGIDQMANKSSQPQTETTLGKNLSQPSGSYNTYNAWTKPKMSDPKSPGSQMSPYGIYNALMPSKATKKDVVTPFLKSALALGDFGSMMTKGQGAIPDGQRGGNLPKHQFQNSQTGVNQSQTPASTFLSPDAMRYNKAFEEWWKLNPMGSEERFMASNKTTNTQGFDYSFKPGSTADPNNPNFQQPQFNEGDISKKGSNRGGLTFDTAFASRAVNNLNTIGDFIGSINELKAQDKEKEKGINTSQWMPVMQSTDRGDYMMNTGMFRPDSYTYSQSGPGMQSQKAWNAQTGGPLDMFEDGGVYDLDENTINMILAMGGSVEYL